MNYKRILCLLLAMMMAFTIAFPTTILADDDVTEPEAVEQEEIIEPVEEPVEEPAEEPVEEPVEEPAEEPAEEPVEEPVEEPAEEVEEDILVTAATVYAELITKEPEDQVAMLNTPVTFSVEAAGEGLTYQWQWNTGSGWKNLPTSVAADSKSDTVSFNATNARAAYSYRVVVKNAADEIDESAEVTFTVKAKPAKPRIKVQPTNQVVAKGSDVTFSVVAEGEDLSYQWKFQTKADGNWVNVSSVVTADTTSPELTFGATAGRAAYKWKVRVTNPGGYVESDEVTFEIKNPPRIKVQPTNQTVEPKGTVTFSVVAEGDDLTYQWKFQTKADGNWVNVSSAVTADTTSPELTFGATAGRAAYKWKVVVSNAVTSVESNVVTFEIKSAAQPPVITVQPQNQTAELNKPVTFSVTAEGEGLSYQWKWNTGSGWKNLPTSVAADSKSASVTFNATNARAAYQYCVEVSNTAGAKVTSDTVTFEIQAAAQPPVITVQPQNQVAKLNSPVTFSVEAEGEGLSYQWKWNTGSGWKNLPTSVAADSKSASVTFNATNARAAYSYLVEVSNAAGAKVQSDVVTFEIKALPTITTQPQDQTAVAGEDVVFAVEAANANTFQWQWDRGDGYENLPADFGVGMEGDTLTFVADETLAAYKYRVVVSNEVGSVESAEVQVTVTPAQIIVDGVIYEKFTETTLVVVGCVDTTAAALTVQETINGMTVTKIGDEAFMDNTALVSIDLPDTIQVIGIRAFKGCINLSQMS